MHKSVLLDEVLENLNLKNDSIVVDCTLGYGGHSSEVLKRINDGFLYAFDQDMEAISYSSKRLSEIGSNYEIIYSNFSLLKEELKKRNVDKVDAIIFDLGVSSPQLDNPERGFSFHNDSKLDMRMDTNQTLSAYEVVNEYSLNDLIYILKNYGEEKFAKNIATAIVNARKTKKIETTLELTEIIKSSVSEKYRREKHPARKTFQAIRIEVNDELNVETTALKDALDMLKVGGRLCVITFHSLEDKICKKIMKEVSELDSLAKKLPVVPEYLKPKFKIVATIKPSEKELNVNNRSRSATLRVIERIREG